MSVYLIDYENVNFSGLEGVGNLTPADEVVIFYSNAASTIPMNLHIDVQKSGARMQYIRIERTGKNYLDFQLSALSGYLVGTTDQTDFVVISRDTGFDSVLDLWNNQDFVGRTLTFRRQDSIGGNIPVKTRKRRGRKAVKADPVSETEKQAAGSAEKGNANADEKKAAKQTGVKSGETAPQKAEGKKSTKAEKGNTAAGKSGKKRGASKKTASKNGAAGGTKADTSLQKKAGAKGDKTDGLSADVQQTQDAAAEFVPVTISAAEKRDVRAAVKELSLKPTDYTKIYRTFEKTPDKQAYNTGLIRAFKDQELGNRIYKATLPVFKARHK